MTLTDNAEIRRELENSSNTVEVFPEDVEDMVQDEDMPNGEIQELEFEEENGRYTVILEDGRKYQICAVCGFRHPTNLEAMRNEVPDLVKDMKEEYKQEEFINHEGEFEGTMEEVEERVEGDLCRWNNARCETRHPPYEPGYLKEA